MDLEFDKEMDSLLRRADRGVLVGDKPVEKPKVHLDADELAAFVENAMPEKTRALHMAHLADCDRCRRILSGLIALNADDATEEVRVAAPAVSPVSAEPWYRRFFLFPNLAYVMGGLVLVFGGLLTFSLLQNPTGENATVSQAVETESARGPMEPFSSLDQAPQAQNGAGSATNATTFNSNSSSVSSNTASSAVANTSSNTAITGASLAPRGEAEGAKPADKTSISVDGADAKTTDTVVTAAPPPVVAAQPALKDAELAAAAPPAKEAAKDEDKALAKKREVREKDDAALSERRMQELPRSQAGGPLKSKPGPSRDAQQNFPNRANNTFDLPTMRRVSGKSFEFRNNVWYDITYRGQATKNVRRGTDEYRDLDKGLRTIAESLSGVVVVVWEGKAYRIQ